MISSKRNNLINSKIIQLAKQYHYQCQKVIFTMMFKKKKNTNTSGGSLDCDFSLSSAGEKRSNWIGVSSKRLSIGVEGGVGGLFDLEESLKSKIN